MKKIINAAKQHNGSEHYNTHWKKCVSVSTSFLSLSWLEFFFDNEEDSKAFNAFCRKEGYVTLVVTPDEY